LTTLVTEDTGLSKQEREQILEIIASVGDIDAREQAIRHRTWPAWRRLLRKLYPQLRRTEYTIEYTTINN
jgi:hypothetical protein